MTAPSVVFRSATLVAVAFALGWAGCSRREPAAAAPAASPTAVAWVGHSPIEEPAFIQAWNKNPHAKRDEVLETLVRRELLLAEILRTGFDQRPDVRESWQAHLIQRFAEEQRRMIATRPEPTPDELSQYHRTHPERFQSPARTKVAILQVRPPASSAGGLREKWETRLERIRQQALALPPDIGGFGSLARDVSEHRASRFQGGELGWMTSAQLRACVPSEVAEGVDALSEAGPISPWIASSQGYFLARVLERQPAALLPFDSVLERVRYEYSRAQDDEAEEVYFRNLRDSFGVQVNPSVLSRLDPPTSVASTPPPPLPGR
ncbi:MAG: peptidyl-prolyl cis-trans isomerase [Verrucomicrobiales bacterium]|nr:peptidyl-prolyl cis-trans isomerase [Verrucomicrobiales bacterium]